MNVERVVSALEFNRSVGVGATFPPGVDPTVSLGPIAAAYNEKPSIFYTPLEGDKFVRQMLTPIGLETILLLTRSGWSSERVLLQTVQTLNHLKNAPSASGPTPESEPEFREFREAVRAPKADEERGRVTRTLTASGDYFDWSDMLEDVLRIESAPTQPEHAAVSVPYRGGWFYIRDEDLQSKTTFSLLAQLITLQAGPAVAGGAALSFSVGGR